WGVGVVRRSPRHRVGGDLRPPFRYARSRLRVGRSISHLDLVEVPVLADQPDGGGALPSGELDSDPALVAAFSRADGGLLSRRDRVGGNDLAGRRGRPVWICLAGGRTLGDAPLPPGTAHLADADDARPGRSLGGAGVDP